MSLAAQQQALLLALWQPRHDEAARSLVPWLNAAYPPEQSLRGLRAYRSNGRELAERALAGAYPVVAQLLGTDNFGPLARSLWLAHPPERGDLAQWGGTLARHIEALTDLAAEEPYLPDVARLEWALHAAATAAGAVLDADSFTLLTREDPARIRLRLAPGTALLASRWPVASIVLAHLQGEPSLRQAGERLREGVAEGALVWRQGLQPRLRAVEPTEAPLLAALKEGASLLDALQSAPALAFDDWLGAAVHSGLVTGAEPM